MEYPEVVTVPTVGIKERTGGGVPGWLTSVFVAVPLFALFYLISNAGGVECGQGGALAVDPISGELVNCDGTPYEGSGAGGGAGGDFLAEGEQVYRSDVAASQGLPAGPGQGGERSCSGRRGCPHHIQQLRGPRHLGAAGYPRLGGSGGGHLRGYRQAGWWWRNHARLLDTLTTSSCGRSPIRAGSGRQEPTPTRRWPTAVSVSRPKAAVRAESRPRAAVRAESRRGRR